MERLAEKSNYSGQYQRGKKEIPWIWKGVLYAVITKDSHSYVWDDLYLQCRSLKKNLYGKKFLTQDTAKSAEQFFILATET